MTREEQLDILENFFNECVRFWERELNVSSKESKEPLLRALEEIPTVNPYVPNGEKLDKEVVEEFHSSKFAIAHGLDEIIKQQYKELYKEEMRKRRNKSQE